MTVKRTVIVSSLPCARYEGKCLDDDIQIQGAGRAWKVVCQMFANIANGAVRSRSKLISWYVLRGYMQDKPSI